MPSLLTAALAATAALALAPSAPVATGRGLQGSRYDEIMQRYSGANVGDHSGGYMFGGGDDHSGDDNGGDDHSGDDHHGALRRTVCAYIVVGVAM